MNTFDPNYLDIGHMNVLEEELSVEEVLQIEAYEVFEKDEDPESNIEIIKNPMPLKFLKGNVSGNYESCPRTWKLELRIDIDGYRPMKRVSGDYYHVSGKTVSYFGSFIVNTPKIIVSSSQVTIIGIADATWNTSHKKIRIIIPRHTIFQPSANAYIQWMTTENKKGSSYTCVYKSRYFRMVDLEQDYEKGVKPFISYNTGSLSSGGTPRTLTVAGAYAEAGIQIQDTGVSNEVRTSEAGDNLKWSNAELHAAMIKHFKLWKDAPEWKVWLFHAMRHEAGPGLLGIMFDQKGKQRQGCATFYQRISGEEATKLRDQLYVCVHELGHCFNLYHSFHKKYMKPPVPNRPAAKSWMNYPGRYPGGAGAYWNDFSFQFDNFEVSHLRHANYNNIIIGGNPFGTGATILEDNVIDNSGLRLELETNKSFALGEPVTTEIKLYVTDAGGKDIHKHIHPNFGFVQIAIGKPSGEVVIYSPPIEHTVEVEKIWLNESNPSIYESAYIGYDKKQGIVFDQPGAYKLRGLYYAIDGSLVISDVISFRVRTLLNSTEEEVADLFLGDNQGMLLYLLGSDSDSLADGNEAFDRVMDKYGANPLAIYAQLIKGFNASREFKNITTDYQVVVRKPEYDKADKLLSVVIDASETQGGVDNITLNMIMRRKASLEISTGKKKEAKETLKRMRTIFKKKQLKPHVMTLINKQMDDIEKDI